MEKPVESSAKSTKNSRLTNCRTWRGRGPGRGVGGSPGHRRWVGGGGVVGGG